MKSDHRIIFIVGYSRSGTTMMSRILNNNDSVHTFQEIHFFENMVPSQKLHNIITKNQALKLLCKLIGIQIEGFYMQKYLDNYLEEATNILQQLPENHITAANIYKEFLFYWTQKNGKSIPCEQTPKNIYYLKEILELFDNVKVINLVRDPRSVLLSQKNKWKRRFLGEGKVPKFETLRAWGLYHPITITQMWKSSIDVSLKKQNDILLSVKFEEILENPNFVLKKVTHFCGIEFKDEMMLVPQIGSSVKSDNPSILGIDKSRISTWKAGGLTPTELYITQKIAIKQMQILEYENIRICPKSLNLFATYISYPIKIIIALTLNLGRMKNIKETLTKRLGK